jgi:hypothetical protein
LYSAKEYYIKPCKLVRAAFTAGTMPWTIYMLRWEKPTNQQKGPPGSKAITACTVATTETPNASPSVVDIANKRSG